jgi:hypothetical protein
MAHYFRNAIGAASAAVFTHMALFAAVSQEISNSLRIDGLVAAS